MPDTPRLPPARRDVLLGLYEGRELLRTGYSAWWGEAGRSTDKQDMRPVAALEKAGLVGKYVPPFWRRVRLTDAGRALAARLAETEGR